MAYQVDWQHRIITIPKADLTQIQTSPTEIRQLDVLDFWKKCRDIEDSPVGMLHPPMVSYIAPVVVSGTSLAAVVTVINDYKVVFENGSYNVNLTGGNTNLGDRTIKNSVGVNTNNAAGLVETKKALTQAEIDAIVSAVVANSTCQGGGTSGQYEALIR